MPIWEDEKPKVEVKAYPLSDKQLLAAYQDATKTGSTAAAERLAIQKRKMGVDPKDEMPRQ